MNDQDSQLSALLHRSAPVPPVTIDVADIARRVRSRRKQTVIAPLAAAAVIAVVAIILAVTASGTNGRSTRDAVPASGPSITSSRVTSSASVSVSVSSASVSMTSRPASLPATIDGVPVAELARQAYASSVAWSEPHPTHVRLVVAREDDVDALVDGHRFDHVPTGKQYVIELDGLFACNPPACDISGPADRPHRSTVPTNAPTGEQPKPLIRMIVTTPVPRATGEGASSGLQVDRRDLDIDSLGHVIDLQPYIQALE